ncbi:MAG: flagellar export chaperone FliS [Treponema sp.]|nr:flagellar export chaperone FliS [Candidatus Treponema equifaecale]
MGFNNNPYSAYQTTAVKTASQGKLIVMLYQGAAKELSAALASFDAYDKIAANKIESFGRHIMKAQEIINELQVSLDMEKGGQISQNLMSLYVYFNKELMNVSIAQDKEKLAFILNMIKELTSAWEVAAANTSAAPQTAQQTLNIQG